MKIALIGYGKMGKTIEQIAVAKNHTIELKIDFDNQHDLTGENLRKCDVAIEFTGPESAVENIYKCFDAGVPVVSGSTGWLTNLENVEKKCIEKGAAFLYASNFSIGVNIFFEVNKKLAQLMERQKEYNVSLEEIHHTQKKDAPSGTAITLAEQILENVHRKKQWVNHESDFADNLVIISERINTAPGTHKIKYSSPIDDIEIIHTAHNRDGFAAGALLAAEFLKDKKKGIYGMKEVLGL
ncbi:MAG: 4-hydroxy-tetrahydrodipicolinate reductase [Ferruginibacter sp.]